MTGVVYEARTERVLELARLYERRRLVAAKGLGRYYTDPAGFARDCIDWPEGEGLAPYQYEALEALQEHKRVSIRSLHGVGKTTTESMAVLWFSITREAMERDWKCPTTAGAWNQLQRYLWPEIHKWARKLRWDKLLRDPFTAKELLTLNLNLTYGQAFAVASAIPAYIEGVHADSVLYVFDESKSIPIATWDAAEGAFTGASGTEAFALSCSTPGEPIGRFYDIQTRRAGYEDWYTIHVGRDKAIAAGRVSEAWAEQRKLQWGAKSALYANRVLGEFHSSDEDAVIPLAWVEMAVERWKDAELLIADPRSSRELGPVTAVGVDVARQGDDQTAISVIHSLRVQEVRYSFHEETTMTTGRVAGIAGRPDVIDTLKLVVDTDGLGAGVTDQLREQGFGVLAFHGGYATDRKDRSGELGFVNWRSAAWWHMREILDPHPCACPGTDWCEMHGSHIELPDDPILIGDLTAPRMKRITSKSKIEVEPKDDTKERLGRSPDAGDCVIMPFFPGERSRRKRRMVAGGRAPRPAPEAGSTDEFG